MAIGDGDDVPAPASGRSSADPSYAATMNKEASVEAYKAKLAGRKDRIEEMKLAISLEDDPEEKDNLKRKLKDFLEQQPPLPSADMN